jgi:hypothetical protein
MSDAPDRLMDAALRPLTEHPEQHQAGRMLLEGMAPQATHPGADAMMARWDAVDTATRRPPLRWMLGAMLVLLSAWGLLVTINEGLFYKRALGWLGLGTMLWTPGDSHELIAKGLSEKNKFLLFGDLSKPAASDRMLALWDSAPDNPAYFAEYAMTYRADHGEYPPEFLATARRLDPANAWFTYHAAADLARNSVKKAKQSYQARKAGETPTWIVLDQAKLNQALALLREASQQKDCVNRQKELVAGRLPLLPQDNQMSRVLAQCHVSGYIAADITLRYLSEVIAAQAWLLGDAGDAAGFRQLLGDADAFIMACGSMRHPTLVDVLLLKANAGTAIRNLQPAAAQLGMPEAALRLKRIKDRLAQLSEDQKNRRPSDQLALRSSLLAGSIDFMQSLVKSPPALMDDALKPGRMIEHLMFARAGSLALWAVLGVGLLVLAVFRYCLPAWMLRLAQRMNALLLPIDWAWLTVAGVLLPFGCVTVLLRCTRLGGQDWGIKATGLILPAADFLALALLLLVVPALIARWRLGRRAAALGICSGNQWPGWLAVAAGLAFVPVLGMSAPILREQSSFGLDWNFAGHWLTWRFALLVPLMLWILCNIVRALAVKFTSQFAAAVVALALIPAYACGMLLSMVSVPVYQAAQTCWERQDPMTEVATNGLNRYEGELAEQLLLEVRQALELEDIQRER